MSRVLVGAVRAGAQLVLVDDDLSRQVGRNPTAFRNLQSRGISATEINRSLARRMTPLSIAYADD